MSWRTHCSGSVQTLMHLLCTDLNAVISRDWKNCIDILNWKWMNAESPGWISQMQMSLSLGRTFKPGITTTHISEATRATPSFASTDCNLLQNFWDGIGPGNTGITCMKPVWTWEQQWLMNVPFMDHQWQETPKCVIDHKQNQNKRMLEANDCLVLVFSSSIFLRRLTHWCINMVVMFLPSNQIKEGQLWVEYLSVYVNYMSGGGGNGQEFVTIG